MKKVQKTFAFDKNIQEEDYYMYLDPDEYSIRSYQSQDQEEHPRLRNTVGPAFPKEDAALLVIQNHPTRLKHTSPIKVFSQTCNPTPKAARQQDKCHRHREAYEKGKEQHVLHKPKYKSIYNTKLNNITIYDTDNNK